MKSYFFNAFMLTLRLRCPMNLDSVFRFCNVLENISILSLTQF